MDNIQAVEVLKYHNFSDSKYLSLDMENTMPESPSPDEEMMAAARKLFSDAGIKVNA